MDPETRDALLQISRSLANMQRRLTRLETLETPQFTTGTWIPAFTGTTIAGSFTYTNQAGEYVVIGNLVFIVGRVDISAIGVAPTGNMTITGLPFAATSTGTRVGLLTVATSNFNYAAGSLYLVVNPRPGAAVLDLSEAFDNVARVACPAGNFTNAACSFIVCGFYPMS